MMFRPLVLAGILIASAAAPLRAHETRPGYLQIRETAEGEYRVSWKEPFALAPGLTGTAHLVPVFPPRCRSEADGVERAGADRSFRLACEGGLAGETIRIAGIESSPSDVLVTLERKGGVRETYILGAGAPSVVVGSTATRTGRALAFLKLGVEHILLGVDHLLFVLGLLLIVRDRRMLVKTITAFTLAHSVTLALATLGYAHAPAAPLNAAIALSILFLGPEVLRSLRGETSLMIQNPWLVALLFGLLHGFGFASGLRSLGLPAEEIPLALLLFNLGVEVGQLLFVVLVVFLERSFEILELRWPRWAESVPGYVVGSLGAFWTIQRTAVLFGWGA